MLMKRLKRESDVMLLFEEQMDEMISMGIIRKVDEEYPKHYLPLPRSRLNEGENMS